MKSLLIATLLIIALSSCSKTTFFEKSDLKMIPRGSTKVIANKNVNPDSLLTSLARQMAKDGWSVSVSKDARQITTDMRSVEGGTSMKVNVYIEPIDNGSMATLTGEWGLNLHGHMAVYSYSSYAPTGTKTIVWTGDLGTKTCLAFQRLMVIATDMGPKKITYGK